MTIAIAAIAAAVLAHAGTAHAGKSNQIRPTPSPLSTTKIVPGEITLTPRVIYTVYDDTLAIPDLPDQKRVYQIISTGVAVGAQLGLATWAAVELGFEAYQKLGSTSRSAGRSSRSRSSASISCGRRPSSDRASTTPSRSARFSP